MIFLIKYWKYFALVALILGILSSLWYYGHEKYNAGFSACKTEYETKLIAANEHIKARKKVIRHETSSLDRASIVAELCSSGWVRSSEGCPD